MKNKETKDVYFCSCGEHIKELYEVCSATWMKNVFDDKDEGDITDYGDTNYWWTCSNTKCHEGREWGMDMPDKAEECEHYFEKEDKFCGKPTVHKDSEWGYLCHECEDKKEVKE
jgi:hypothetical protein